MRNDSPRDSLEKITQVYNLSSHLHVIFVFDNVHWKQGY